MPNRSTEHSLTLTVDEVAALIGVSRSTAYELVATAELPTVRLRRRNPRAGPGALRPARRVAGRGLRGPQPPARPNRIRLPERPDHPPPPLRRWVTGSGERGYGTLGMGHPTGGASPPSCGDAGDTVLRRAANGTGPSALPPRAGRRWAQERYRAVARPEYGRIPGAPSHWPLFMSGVASRRSGSPPVLQCPAACLLPQGCEQRQQVSGPEVFDDVQVFGVGPILGELAIVHPPHMHNGRVQSPLAAAPLVMHQAYRVFVVRQNILGL